MNDRLYARFVQEVLISGKTFKVQRIRTPEEHYAITLACNQTRLQVWDYTTTAEANQAYRSISSTLHLIKSALDSNA